MAYTRMQGPIDERINYIANLRIEHKDTKSGATPDGIRNSVRAEYLVSYYLGKPYRLDVRINGEGWWYTAQGREPNPDPRHKTDLGIYEIKTGKSFRDSELYAYPPGTIIVQIERVCEDPGGFWYGLARTITKELAISQARWTPDEFGNSWQYTPTRHMTGWSTFENTGLVLL